MDVDILNVANKIETDMEMHDRLIIATAIHYDAALITKDEQIIATKLVSTIW